MYGWISSRTAKPSAVERELVGLKTGSGEKPGDCTKSGLSTRCTKQMGAGRRGGGDFWRRRLLVVNAMAGNNLDGTALGRD